MHWLVQFIEALPKARASITSSSRWPVSGDNANDRRFVNSFQIIVLAKIKGHIRGNQSAVLNHSEQPLRMSHLGIAVVTIECDPIRATHFSIS
jgi:hypothetical protein